MSTPNLPSPSIFIGKQGKGIISFGSGQPDLPPPRQAIKGLKIREDLRYGLIQGELKLRQALSKEYPASSPKNFVITNGASEALDLIFRTLAKGLKSEAPSELASRGAKAGKVLLGKPYYYSYPHIIKFAGLTPVYTLLKQGKIDINDFKKKVKTCQVVLINSPSNPTGRIENMDTLKEIEKITQKLNIFVISDEVYKDLIYERENYLIKGKNVITVNSFSKTYAMCGVRVGYLWSPNQKFINKIIDIKTHTSMNTNLVGQDMALNAIKAPKSYTANQLKIWRRRRNLIYNGLRNLGLDLWKPEGAFYVLPKIKNPDKFVWTLYKKYKVITYPGKWFGAPDRVRLSYALAEKQIKQGLKRIEKCLQEI